MEARAPRFDAGTLTLAGALVALLVVFTVSSQHLAAARPLWADEIGAYEVIASTSIDQSVIHGIAAQSSPSPMDYVLLQVVLGIERAVGDFGLGPLRLLRLHYVVVAWIVVCGAFLLVRCDRDPIAAAGWVLAAGPFLFGEMVFRFTAEMRPYGLWVLLSLALLFLVEHRRAAGLGAGVVALALGLTTTASAVQLGALLVALFIASRLRPRLDGLVVGLLLGFAAIAYYYLILPSPDMGYAHWFQPSWREFGRAWIGFVPWLVVGVGIAIVVARRGEPARLAAVLTATGWLAAAPVLFWLVARAHYFFAPRQLIFCHAASAFLLYQGLRVVFADLALGRAWRLAVVAAGIVGFAVWAFGAASMVRAATGWPTQPLGVERLAELRGTGIPERIEVLAPSRLPAGSWLDAEALEAQARFNAELWLSRERKRRGGSIDPTAVLLVAPVDASAACGVPCAGFEIVGVDRRP